LLQVAGLNVSSSPLGDVTVPSAPVTAVASLRIPVPLTASSNPLLGTISWNGAPLPIAPAVWVTVVVGSEIAAPMVSIGVPPPMFSLPPLSGGGDSPAPFSPLVAAVGSVPPALACDEVAAEGAGSAADGALAWDADEGSAPGSAAPG
jgi:hypothetical protein